MLAIALSLASSLSWGISDFLGGIKSRQLSVVAVLAITQPVGLVLAVALALAIGGEQLPIEDFLVAAGAGIAGVMALGAFYQALAMGTVSVVAPIGSFGVAVPVVVGLARGEQPEAIQLAGIGLALVAVVLVSREPAEDHEARARTRLTIGLAALAALGFGGFFVGIDAAAERDAAWTVVAARLGGVPVVLAVAAVVRPKLVGAGSTWPPLLAIGFFDILANTLYAVATTEGLLALVSVGASLYPAVTVLLARIFLGERLDPVRQAGVVVAVVAVAMIAAGS